MARPPGRLQSMTKANPLKARLDKAIGNRSVEAAAKEWGVPYYVLRDVLARRTRVPRDAAHTDLIATGAGMTTGFFLELAYSLAPATT